MPIPNGGLITETNQQYYEGAQGFQQDVAGSLTDFTTTFDTNLVFGSYDPTNVTVKSKTKVNKEYKPMWKEAVKDWRKSGADISSGKRKLRRAVENYIGHFGF